MYCMIAVDMLWKRVNSYYCYTEKWNAKRPKPQ